MTLPPIAVRGSLACVVALAAVLGTAMRSEARHVPHRDGLGLSCRQILALGRERYYRRHEQGSGSRFGRTQEDEVWDTYTVCRRAANDELRRRLLPREQQRLRAFERVLTAWEESALLCAIAETQSASISRYLYHRSQPPRYDLIRNLIPQLRFASIGRRSRSPELARAFERCQRLVREWEEAARSWSRMSDIGHKAGSGQLRAQIPRLRKYIQEVRSRSYQFPLRGQKAIAHHVRDLLDLLTSYLE